MMSTVFYEVFAEAVTFIGFWISSSRSSQRFSPGPEIWAERGRLEVVMVAKTFV